MSEEQEQQEENMPICWPRPTFQVVAVGKIFNDVKSSSFLKFYLHFKIWKDNKKLTQPLIPNHNQMESATMAHQSLNNVWK